MKPQPPPKGWKAPWWTDADQADLDVLTWELVGGGIRHRERCATCRDGETPCQALAIALDVILDWRRGRVLRSKAAWLRARQNERAWRLAEARAGVAA